MNKSLKFVVGAIALLVGSSSAFAMLEGGRWYADVRGGGAFIGKIKAHSQVNSASDNSVKQKGGWVGAAAVGYSVDSWSFELEGKYCGAKIKTVRTAGSDQAGLHGRVRIGSLMGNVLYGIALADSLELRLGAGLGWGSMNVKSDGATATGYRMFNGHASLFAYQLKADLCYSINDNWSIVGGYTFFSSFNKPKIKSDLQTTKVHLKRPYVNQVTVGVCYKF